MVLTATGEALMLFLHLFSIVLLDDNLPDEKSFKYGWFIIVIVGGYILVNWTIIMTILIMNLC